jgi:hypothetical protein
VAALYIGRFNADYFAEAELEEMNSLIETFARQSIGASEISEASHQAIAALTSTFSLFLRKIFMAI